jgi:hypothetical protein
VSTAWFSVISVARSLADQHVIHTRVSHDDPVQRSPGRGDDGHEVGHVVDHVGGAIGQRVGQVGADRLANTTNPVWAGMSSGCRLCTGSVSAVASASASRVMSWRACPGPVPGCAARSAGPARPAICWSARRDDQRSGRRRTRRNDTELSAHANGGTARPATQPQRRHDGYSERTPTRRLQPAQIARSYGSHPEDCRVARAATSGLVWTTDGGFEDAARSSHAESLLVVVVVVSQAGGEVEPGGDEADQRAGCLRSSPFVVRGVRKTIRRLLVALSGCRQNCRISSQRSAWL